MKAQALLLSSAILLSGCAAVDSFFMARYDNIEYYLINKISTVSELGKKDCNEIQLSRLNFNILYSTSYELKNYSQFIPRNEETVKMSVSINELIKQGKDMYDNNNALSETFCKLKLDQINRAATTAQKVIGNKPR